MSEPQWKKFVRCVGKKWITEPGRLAGMGPAEVLDDFLDHIDGIDEPLARVWAADIVANRDEAERILAAAMGLM